MKSTLSLTLAFTAALLLAACGEHDHDHAHDHDHTAANGGVLVEVSDHSMHFEVKHDVAAGLLQVWVYDGSMKAISTSAPTIQLAKDSGGGKLTGTDPKGGSTAHEWHFGDRALSKPVQGRLRVEHDGKTYNVDLPEADAHGHGHEHGDDDDHGDHGEHGPHDGMVTTFAESGDSATVGYVELKLHDDKGDLELWLATDKQITKPFDLPLDATITVTFHDKNKRVTLAVRNKDKNEDEDGKANVRDGKTNYFIFPGDSGADASWLMGEEFEAQVSVTFEQGGTAYTTAEFELVPHTHGAHGHK